MKIGPVSTLIEYRMRIFVDTLLIVQLQCKSFSRIILVTTCIQLLLVKLWSEERFRLETTEVLFVKLLLLLVGFYTILVHPFQSYRTVRHFSDVVCGYSCSIR